MDKEFPDWFRRISKLWRAFFEQNDQVLGLAPASGRAGGYRQRLYVELQKWQKAKFDLILNYDGFFCNCLIVSKLNLT